MNKKEFDRKDYNKKELIDQIKGAIRRKTQETTIRMDALIYKAVDKSANTILNFFIEKEANCLEISVQDLLYETKGLSNDNRHEIISDEKLFKNFISKLIQELSSYRIAIKVEDFPNITCNLYSNKKLIIIFSC